MALGEACKMLDSLPEDCISCILSFTSPRDTCRFATLSSLFRSAAASDQVWANFLPSNYQDVVSRADAADAIHSSSKKDIFFRLHDYILIDGGKNSITLEETTGKICYMISASELELDIRDFSFSDDVCVWVYPTIPESRFANVAQLNLPSLQADDLSLRVVKELKAAKLSENTTYVVFLVYRITGTYVNAAEDDSFIKNIAETYVCSGVVEVINSLTYSCLFSEEDIHKASKNLSKEEVEMIEGQFQFWVELNIKRPDYLPCNVYFPKEREGSSEWREVALGEFLNENGVGEEKDDKSKSYRIQAVSVAPGNFESQKALPLAWRGMTDDELSKESDIPGCDFVHISGFIGGNLTMEGVIAMARASL